jgi:DNA-binding response OmpR family regulator
VPAPSVCSVLIADGNRAFANALSSVLQQSGFVAFCAYSARETEMITSGLCPDIVLLGKLPAADDAVALATTVQKRNHCRVILLLEADAKPDPRISSGTFTTLRKPLRPAELVQEITRVVASKSRSAKRPFLVGRDAP